MLDAEAMLREAEAGAQPIQSGSRQDAPSAIIVNPGDPDRIHDRVATEIASLRNLDLQELRIRWRRLFRRPAPEHLPRYLLLRIIAYRMQARVLGDLDRETARYLDQVAREWKKRAGKGRRSSKHPPPVPPVPDGRAGKLKPGTILAREHDGMLHRVIVMADGFAWNGTTYRSLSQVARAITSTNWNGPAFFGLRSRAKVVVTPSDEVGVAP